jgi:hypothetical protein
MPPKPAKGNRRDDDPSHEPPMRGCGRGAALVCTDRPGMRVTMTDLNRKLPDPGADRDRAGLALAPGSAEFYRAQAQRLVGLADTSPFADAKQEFLDLAQCYEALAEHAAQRGMRRA